MKILLALAALSFLTACAHKGPYMQNFAGPIPCDANNCGKRPTWQ